MTLFLRSTSLFATLALVWSAGCHPSPESPEPVEAGGHHVLFVGNSLTYTNDLPRMVAEVARAAGDTIRAESATGPNLALIDHLKGATNAVALIRRGGWEYVVLQQGPTPPGICRDSLVLWTRMFATEIRAAGATPALLMTWPASTGLAGFDDVRISFQEAARAVDGVFLPAGEAWRAAWEADPNLGLYGPDGFHPSPLGTVLVALEVYERVTGHDVRAVDPASLSGGGLPSLPVAMVRLLQGAAHTANQRYPAHDGQTAGVPSQPRAAATRC